MAKKNYSYIRELRNSVVHRGHDITSASHLLNDFPVFIAPPLVKNQNGKKQYSAICFYLIEVIDICEKLIGNILALHIENYANKLSVLTDRELVEQSQQFVIDSDVMPDWVKEHALNFIQSEDFSKIKFDGTARLLVLLRNNAIPVDLASRYRLSRQVIFA